MKNIIKYILENLPFYDPIRNFLFQQKQLITMREWKAKGRPFPPPHILKQEVLKEYAKRFNIKVMVETGTFYGDMVEAMKGTFNQIYSIELSKELFAKAKKRFKNDQNIEILQGDSGKVLKEVLSKITQPALFWLDGHYSAGVTAKGDKETPIYEELEQILSDKKHQHVIIIDDARLFGSDPSYPDMIELKSFILSKNNNLDITVQDDSIRIIPRK